MTLAAVALDDKYTLETGRVYLTGIQALVRLPMMQRRRDQAFGLNTAGFLSGYRGSPLGGLDQNLWQAKRFLERNHIRFEPGLNEDLAATAIWGSQQTNLFPGAKYDGVFAYWYGKGLGVDRTGDVFKHANATGTARHGGVLALAGDDHAASPRRCPTSRDTPSSTPRCPFSTRRACRTFSISGFTAGRCPRISRCCRAASTFAGRITTRSRSSGGCGNGNCPRSTPSPAPTGSTASPSTARGHGSASSPPASLISMSARRWPSSVSTTAPRRQSASASTRLHCPGRSSPRVSAASPRASRRSSSSRKSARWSRRS